MHKTAVNWEFGYFFLHHKREITLDEAWDLTQEWDNAQQEAEGILQASTFQEDQVAFSLS